MVSRKKKTQKLIGRKVTLRWGTKSIEGTLVEDRGPLGVGGRQLVRVEFSFDSVPEKKSLELPLEEVEFTDEEE